MRNIAFVSAICLMGMASFSSCKKCTTCTATDSNGKVIAQQQYCSSSSTNMTTFENSFKTTYGHTSVCKPQ